MRAGNEEKSRLFGDIYLSLRQDILWLRLKPGTILSEAWLAEQFKSSKTPVREALMRLSFDGLVESIPRRGYCVSEISFSDIKDMHEYRWVLESSCLEKAAECATEEQLARLDSLSYTDRPFFRDEEPRFSLPPRVEERDSEFHIYLAEIAGNRIIHAQLIDVLEKLQRPMLCVAEENYMSRGMEEHHIMACLLREKKLDEARRLLRGHINEVYEHCLRISAIAKLF